jgi:3-deoxy-manno-octulosonate cytidylyltransferase (CMP-KDO synthetase)
MHRIAVIPARYASTRLPGKPLRDLGGRPLIVRVLEAVRACPLLDRAIVATDDERIARAVRETGEGEVRMTSPDHRSGTDRVAEVLGREQADWVVNVQGDEPFLEPGALQILLERAAEEGGRDEVGTLVEPVVTAEEWEDPSVVKAVADSAGRALYFSRAPIPGRMPGEDAKMSWEGAWKHVGVYSCSREMLLRWAGMPASPLERREGLEQLRLLEAGVPIRLIENPGRSLGVDTEADLEEARRRWAANTGSEHDSERKSD